MVEQAQQPLYFQVMDKLLAAAQDKVQIIGYGPKFFILVPWVTFQAGY